MEKREREGERKEMERFRDAPLLDGERLTRDTEKGKSL